MGLFELVPNFSEGRRPEVVDAIVDALTGVDGAYLLDRGMDPDHNRCVITLAGEGEPLMEAAVRGLAEAKKHIDLNNHTGEHKRMGAMDVCPFVPLPGSTTEEAAAWARKTGERIGTELEIPIYLYGAAAFSDERRKLGKIRNKQFEKLLDLVGTDDAFKPDYGPGKLHPTAGASGVGARFFLLAYNVNLESDDLELAKAIAKQVRERDGGFKCVQGMGFMLEDQGIAQVSMNLTNYRTTSIRTVYDAIAEAAGKAGVEVRESEVIGLVPEEALDDATAVHVKVAGYDPAKMILERRLEQVKG